MYFSVVKQKKRFITIFICIWINFKLSVFSTSCDNNLWTKINYNINYYLLTELGSYST